MATKFDARQTISRDTLDQIANNVADKEVDDLLRSVDEELTMPLRMKESSPADRVLNIDNITVTNPEHSRKRTIPPINNLLPSFASGTVTFPASNGGNITNDSGGPAVLLNITASHYVKAGINLNSLGQIVVTLGESNAAAASAGTPAVPTGTFALGFVIIQNVAGNISNVENTNIYQYMGGGGSGSGTGDSNSITETIKNHLINSPFNLVTPNIASIDEDNLIASFGGSASFSVVDLAWKFAVATDSITSIQMLDANRFLDEGKDLASVRLVAFWDEDGIDTGATYQVSRDGGTHWADMSAERVDDTEVFHADYDWLSEEEDEVEVENATGTGNVVFKDFGSFYDAVAAKFSFSSQVDVTELQAKLQKVTAGTLAGNFRFTIFNDDGTGKPGNMLVASDWYACDSINAAAGGTDYPISIDYSYLVAGDDYFFVIETDNVYKAAWVSGLEEMRWIRDTTGTNLAFQLDGAVWTAVPGATMVYKVTGDTEHFATVDEYDVANATNTTELNITTERLLSQSFTLSDAEVVKKLTLYLSKDGSPTGGMYAKLVRDDSGDPSDDVEDLLGESPLKSMSDISAGDSAVEFDIPNMALPAGTYHIVCRTDADYKTNYSALNRIKWRGDDTSPPVAGKRNNGTAWSALGVSMNFCYKLEGRPLDLRVKVISSGTDKLLNGYGLFYDHEVIGVTGGVNNVKIERFKAVADNLNSFTLPWLPDPALVRVYYAEAGQVFVWPQFSVNGHTLVFATDFFNNGGTEADVTLMIEQTNGSTFDNSDQNASLLAENHLGSLDSTISRARPGRGIKMERPDGVLRELTIDNSDNIAIKATS